MRQIIRLTGITLGSISAIASWFMIYASETVLQKDAAGFLFLAFTLGTIFFALSKGK